MHTEPKTLLSKILKEHIGSMFKNYRVERKLLQELGLGLDFIDRVMLIIQKDVSLLN